MSADHISEVLIVTGLLTMGAITAFLIPSKILKFVFGVVDATTGTKFIAQHWGLLVFLVGALLRLRAHWTRIAVRVAGSWIAASGLLMLGWSFRGT